MHIDNRLSIGGVIHFATNTGAIKGHARCTLLPTRGSAAPRVGLSGALIIMTYPWASFQCTPMAYKVTKVTLTLTSRAFMHQYLSEFGYGVIVLSVSRKFQQYSYEIPLLLIFTFVS